MFPYKNVIIDPLPDTVEVGGKEYPISSGFRTGMLFEQMFMDPKLSNREKVIGAFKLYFPESNLRELLINPEPFSEAIFDFYRCGKEKPKQDNRPNRIQLQRTQVYCFEHDAPYILSSFWSDYQIDLSEVDLHWWKFKALFDGLSEESKMVKIMSYRITDLGQIKDKREKARIARLKAIYALPVNVSTEQRIANAGSIFGRGSK